MKRNINIDLLRLLNNQEKSLIKELGDKGSIHEILLNIVDKKIAESLERKGFIGHDYRNKIYVYNDLTWEVFFRITDAEEYQDKRL